MKIIVFDQFEFSSWESEEILVVATLDKNLRGVRETNLEQFYKKTENYDLFHQWQEKSISSARINSIKDLHETFNISKALKEMCLIDIEESQEIISHHDEWNLIDILWETKETFFRAMWCTTA